MADHAVKLTIKDMDLEYTGDECSDYVDIKASDDGIIFEQEIAKLCKTVNCNMFDSATWALLKTRAHHPPWVEGICSHNS